MAIVTTYKGRHYDGWFPLPWPDGIHFGLQYAAFRIKLKSSCKYEFEKYPERQGDWNKLVGISWGLPHGESARFAWRWNPEMDLAEIAAYPYTGGVSSYKEMVINAGSDKADEHFLLGRTILEEEFTLRIIAPPGSQHYVFEPRDAEPFLGGNGSYAEISGKYRGPGFILGGYFGGRSRAPHKMKWDRKRIKSMPEYIHNTLFKL